MVESITTVPNEVLGIIFDNLRRTDLKASRLVCRHWSTLAIGNLFKTIYISCRDRDLETFDHITSHGLFRRTVRKLVYDCSSTLVRNEVYETDDWDLSLYTGHLISQWQDLREDSDYGEHLFSRWQHLLDDYCLFNKVRYDVVKPIFVAREDKSGASVSSAIFPYNLRIEDLVRHSDIISGHKAYSTLQRQERDFLRSKEPLARIVRGLRNLPHLEKVTFYCSPCYQSPFYRSWPPTYMFPELDDRIKGQELAGPLYDRTEVYNDGHNVLIRALSLSGRKIKKLITEGRDGHGVPRSFFDETHIAEQNLHCMLDVYSGLESLTLMFGTQCGSGENPKWINLCMPNLMELNVSQQDFIMIGFITPFMFQHWSFPRLRRLSLDNIWTTEEYLLRILKTYPLQSFTMGAIMIDGSSWAHALDSIRNLEQRPQHISCEGPLHVEDDVHHWDYLEREIDKIEDYLNFGGVNPLARSR